MKSNRQMMLMIVVMVMMRIMRMIVMVIVMIMMMIMRLKQTQLLRLQFCLVTAGVTEWIECSQLSHFFYKQLAGNPLTPGSVLDPMRGDTRERRRRR